jgi:hypothetical protein
MRDHLSEDEITAYSAGSLEAEVKTDLESHATECNRCMDALEERLRLWVRWVPDQDD